MEFYTQPQQIKTHFNPLAKAVDLTKAHARRLRRQRRKLSIA